MRKIQGQASRRLFSEICLEYCFSCAPHQCFETFDEAPIFSRLSAQHRIRLIRQVAVGLMCDAEPLPPSTVEHIGTYKALIDSILLQIEAESDDAEAKDAPPALLDIPA